MNRKEIQKQTEINKMALSIHLPINTLNINALNASIKIHRVAKLKQQ